MKKLLIVLLALLMCTPALAELPADLSEVDWHYMAHMESGVTFEIPRDTTMLEISEAQQAEGIISIGMNNDYTMQLRSYEAGEASLDAFKVLLTRLSSAEVEERVTMDGTRMLCYRNTAGSANSELFGIMLTGLDGRVYKLSIFTGMDDDFSDDALVWLIAEEIANRAFVMDYSSWGLE